MALVRRFPVGGSTEDPTYQPGEQPGLVRRTATAGGLMPPSTDPTALTGPKVPGETLRDPLAPQMPRTVAPGSVPPQMGAPASPAPPPNTDVYATPGYTPGNFGGVMAGWDPDKWTNTSHQTPKYAVGRILSQYGGTVDGLTQAIPEIQKAYPGTTFNGKDKISIPGVGVIDVLRSAGLGGQGFQWIPDEGAGIPDAYVPPTAESGQPNETQQRDALLAALEGRTPRTRRYRMTEEA